MTSSRPADDDEVVTSSSHDDADNDIDNDNSNENEDGEDDVSDDEAAAVTSLSAKQADHGPDVSVFSARLVFISWSMR